MPLFNVTKVIHGIHCKEENMLIYDVLFIYLSRIWLRMHNILYKLNLQEHSTANPIRDLFSLLYYWRTAYRYHPGIPILAMVIPAVSHKLRCYCRDRDSPHKKFHSNKVPKSNTKTCMWNFISLNGKCKATRKWVCHENKRKDWVQYTACVFVPLTACLVKLI